MYLSDGHLDCFQFAAAVEHCLWRDKIDSEDDDDDNNNDDDDNIDDDNDANDANDDD